MLKIWGRTNSVNVQKVLWTLGELDLRHERIDAGGVFGGLDTDAFGALNPNRRIPVIDDGGVVVWESNAIVRYLAARYGRGTLWPEDPGLRARADQWMDWQVSTLLPDMTPLFWQLIRTPAAERDEALIAAVGERVAGAFALLDAHLATHPFVAGDTFTMGDVPLGAMGYRWLHLPCPRPALGHLEGWYRRLEGRRAYQAHVMRPIT